MYQKTVFIENSSIFGQIELKIGQNWSIFPAISRGRISREKCLAKPFLVLARNARNVHVYLLHIGNQLLDYVHVLSNLIHMAKEIKVTTMIAFN